MTYNPLMRVRQLQRLTHSSTVSFGVLLLVGFSAVHLIWLVFNSSAGAQRALWGNVLYLLPSLVAAVVVLSVAWGQQGKAQRGWLLIGLGLTAQVVGNSIWTYLEVVAKVEPFPSAGDLFYLMFGPLLAAGLLHLTPPPRDRLEGSRLALDLAITVGAVGLYFWRFLLAPPLAWGMDNWMTLSTLAYPLLDLMLLGLLMLTVLRERRDEPPRLDLLLMGMGVAIQVGGDLLYNVVSTKGTYYTGHPIDGLWTVSTVLVVFAACASFSKHRVPLSQDATTTLNGYLMVVTPYLAVASGLGLLLTTQANLLARDTVGGKGVLYGAVAVTLLVVVRQLLAFNENWRLAKNLACQSETLELKVQERTAEMEALSNTYRYAALHEALTDLPNRAHFQMRLQQVVGRADPFAVLYLDFDRFKAVNDSFGHAVGDRLLVAIARRLETCVRPGDLIARLGGDEFAVLLEGSGSLSDAAGIAERLSEVFQVSVQIDDHLLHCSASIGIVLSDVDCSSAENVLRDADIAMYRAKAAGRSQFVIFEPTMLEQVLAKLALEADLRGIVERGELEVYYQPVLETASGTIAGFEALVRWQHPARGLVSPGMFIPLAEEIGLIIEIDRWVLRTACAQLRIWSAVAPALCLNVNLSSRQFTSPNLATFVATVLAEYDLEPHRLRIELTEGLLLDTSLAVLDTLAALRELGVRLHIDDFGTGYSSLSYLQRLDADALKVDRSFIAKMLEREDSDELVRTVVNMAHNLGMQVIAEGVETEAQYRRLKELGCEYVQGFLFSKPVPAAAADYLLQASGTPVTV